MASTDWTEMTGGLSSSDVRRGVTGGVTTPNGGGTFAFGMRSEQVVAGAVAFFTNQANFAPTPVNKGASVRSAILRATSAGSTGFQPFLFVGAQGSDVLSSAYMLGLTDEDRPGEGPAEWWHPRCGTGRSWCPEPTGRASSLNPNLPDRVLAAPAPRPAGQRQR
jgi:hypothetical protein